MHSGYGKLEVIRGVSLSLVAGEIVAMIGPNGAGKSTLLRTIIGFLRPTSGALRLGGESIAGLRPHQLVRRGIAYVMQGHHVLPFLNMPKPGPLPKKMDYW